MLIGHLGTLSHRYHKLSGGYFLPTTSTPACPLLGDRFLNTLVLMLLLCKVLCLGKGYPIRLPILGSPQRAHGIWHLVVCSRSPRLDTYFQGGSQVYCLLSLGVSLSFWFLFLWVLYFLGSSALLLKTQFKYFIQYTYLVSFSGETG